MVNTSNIISYDNVKMGDLNASSVSENLQQLTTRDGLFVKLLSDSTYRIFIVSLIVGLAIRFVLIPITSSPFDEGEGWVAIIDSFYAGEDLYTSGWYLYPPIWGYILSIIGEIAQFLNISSFGEVFSIYGDKFNCIGYCFVTTLEFNILVKMPAFVFDLLTGYAIYRLAFRITKDVKKSCISFAIWFLCPVVIISSACLAMFDSIIVFLIVASIIAFLEKRYFITGIFVAFGIFTKFFPILMTPVMIAYILSEKEEPMKKRIMNVIYPFIAMVLVFIVVYAPVLINGEFMDSLTFITMRSESAANSGFTLVPTFNNIIYYVPLIIVEYLLLMLFMIKSNEKNRSINLLWAIMLSFVPIFALPFVSYTPTYGIVLIPSIVILYCLKGKIAWVPWIALLTFPIHGIMHYWGQMIYPLAAFTDVVDLSVLQQEFPIHELYVIVIALMCLSGISFICVMYHYWKNDELQEVDYHPE